MNSNSSSELSNPSLKYCMGIVTAMLSPCLNGFLLNGSFIVLFLYEGIYKYFFFLVGSEKRNIIAYMEKISLDASSLRKERYCHPVRDRSSWRKENPPYGL